MSWIFWVAIFAWVIPIVIRKLNQSAQRSGQLPPRFPRQGQDPSQGQYPQQGQYPTQGQAPSGPGWWQQPLPPGFPGQPLPEQQPAPEQQLAPEQQPAPEQQAPDAPQGYRARRLAELDRRFSDQEISLEEYMRARNDIMRG